MKNRITLETWNKFYGRVDTLGVLHEVPDEARRTIEEAGYLIGETILSTDGQRVWRLRERTRRLKKTPSNPLMSA